MPTRKQMTLRCYIFKGADGLWESYCVDLSLAARGESFEATRRAMMAQVEDYMEYALRQPEDQQQRLLSRKAPLSQRVTFQGMLIRDQLRRFFGNGGNRPSAGGATSFSVPVPLAA